MCQALSQKRNLSDPYIAIILINSLTIGHFNVGRRVSKSRYVPVLVPFVSSALNQKK